jgi:hypothetical protein
MSPTASGATGSHVVVVDVQIHPLAQGLHRWPTADAQGQGGLAMRRGPAVLAGSIGDLEVARRSSEVGGEHGPSSDMPHAVGHTVALSLQPGAVTALVTTPSGKVRPVGLALVHEPAVDVVPAQRSRHLE